MTPMIPTPGPAVRVTPLLTEGARSLSRVGPPPMLIEELLPIGSLVLVTGAKFTSKTFFALEAARAVATGSDFMGKWKVEQPGNVLIVEQDSPRYDTGRALWAMLAKQFHDEGEEFRTHEGYSLVDPIYISWHPDLNLMQRRDAMRIAETANALFTFRGEGTFHRTELSFGPGGQIETAVVREVVDFGYKGTNLIILDSSRSLHKGKENESGEMEVFIQNAKYIRQATGACVLIIAHDSATGEKTRGSTAIDAGVDSEYAITKRRKDKDYGLYIRKARAIAPHEYRYTVTTDEVPEIGVTKVVAFKEFIEEKVESDPRDEVGPREQLFAHIAQGPITRQEILAWASLNAVGESSITKYLKEGITTGYLSVTYKGTKANRTATYRVGKENA